MDIGLQKVENFALPDSADRAEIIDEISKIYSIVQERQQTRQQSFFDTFDWRLHNKGLTFLKEASVYHLRSRQQDRDLATLSPNNRIKPKFWWDFPDSPLKEQLKTFLGVRALLPLASMKTRFQTVRILNQDEKTVLRVQLEEIRAGDAKTKSGLICSIKLEPVRGYLSERQAVSRFLRKLGLKPQKQDAFTLAVAHAGRQPGDYSSKLSITLSPEWPGIMAAKKTFAYLLSVMKQNEAGIKADIDTEFLHDFRVAIRRTRSALAQIKSVFSQEITDGFKRDFSTLGKLTNKLRDLDVYLLKRDEYRTMLPEPLCSDLEPMFEKLRKERRQEHQKVVKSLNAATYKRIIRTWGEFLNQTEDGRAQAGKNSDTPVLELARKFVKKQYNQVMALGKEITDDSPDPMLHNLRIECKKLRYLLEFFASLFPTRNMAILIKQLKKLQDNLGDFNDLYVQQESLKEFLSNDTESARTQNMTAAIGGLIGVLYQRQEEVRTSFAKTFTRFSDPKNSALFNKLFG